MICRERQLVFVHIPKCGGTSIEDLLWPKPRRQEDLWMGFVRPGYNKYQTGGLQHLTAALICKEIGAAAFDSYYRFALVRHPLDRIISQYNYLNTRPDLCEVLSLDSMRTFDVYLDRIATIEHVQWTPQVNFLVDESGERLVDVFRLEDLSRDFTPLSRKLGLRSHWRNRLGRPLKAMPHSNRHPHDGSDSSTLVISRKTVAADQARRVYGLFKEDYALLGYDED